MPNRRLSLRVPATRAGQHRRGRHRSRRGSGGGWLPAVKVAVLLEMLRRRRSSPSFRQIALVIVTGGLAITIIRIATRKAKSNSGGTGAASEDEAHHTGPEGERGVSDDAVPEDSPTTGRSDTGTGNERRFTDRVQQEMFRRADAPTQAGGAGSG
jgi:hypothetical protein